MAKRKNSNGDKAAANIEQPAIIQQPRATKRSSSKLLAVNEKLEHPAPGARRSASRRTAAATATAQPKLRKPRLATPVLLTPRPVKRSAPSVRLQPPRPVLAARHLPVIVPIAPESQPATFVDRGLPLPEGYSLDRLVLLVRDPLWLFAYWELQGSKLAELRELRGQAFVDSCAWVLRLYWLNERSAIDIEIQPTVGNWYIHVAAAGKYQAELALLSPDGEWISLMASQIVETPAPEASSKIDEQWRLRPEDEAALAEFLRQSQAGAEPGSAPFLGASRVESSFALAARPGSSWNSEALGGGAAEHMRAGAGGHLQAKLPAGAIYKAQQPHFKVKLPRCVEGVGPAAPTWPVEPKS